MPERAGPGYEKDVGIPAHEHFSGKRATERRAVDLRVELLGGGIVLQGRAVDLALGGVGVALTERTLQGFREVSDAVSAFRLLETHFTSGLVVRFPVHGDIRVPARVARIVTAPVAGGDLVLGLRFARALAADEWTRLTEQRRLVPVPTLAPLRPGPPVQVLVSDPRSGPVCLLRAIRGATSFVQGVVDSARPLTVEEVRTGLGVTPLPTRVTLGNLTWSGEALARDVHASSTEGLTVVLETSAPLPEAFLRRLGRTT